MQLLIVDDHPVIFSACKALLTSRFALELLSASDVDTGWEAFEKHNPDVVVIDINLPGVSGFDLVRRIVEAKAQTPIIVFTMNEDLSYATRAIQMGARGFLTKGDDPIELVRAVDHVLAGERYLPERLARQLAFSRPEHQSPIDKLSPRDLELLRLIGQGLPLPEISRRLSLSYKTAANNSSLLRKKLGVSSHAELIRVAIQTLS